MAHSSTELSVGTDLSWRLRALIESGRLRADQRLPGVRDMATGAEVNVNTVRGLYRRLEDDGLAVSRHGSGTFVAPHVMVSPLLEEFAARVAAEAVSIGIDPRQLARALYTGSEDDAFGTAEADRAGLRAQIARLEGILAAFPEAEAPAGGARPAVPRIPTTGQLEAIRDELLDRVDAARARAADSLDVKPRPRKPQGSDQASAEPGRGPIGALVSWWRSITSPRDLQAAP